jgi:hypothetical protein
MDVDCLQDSALPRSTYCWIWRGCCKHAYASLRECYVVRGMKSGLKVWFIGQRECTSCYSWRLDWIVSAIYCNRYGLKDCSEPQNQ